MTWNFILYLLYGLAFFTLGVAILSRDIRLSELGIARIIWLLAIFGIIHGFHEWLVLLEQLQPSIKTPAFSLFRLAVVSLSFLFLLYFGLFLNIITLYGDQSLKTTKKSVKLLIGILALSLILITVYFDLGSDKDLYTRRFVAFPGGLLSGIGLVLYSRVVKTFSRNVAINFIFAGSFMICYSLLSGVVSSDAVVPFFHVKVILFRGLSAFLIMFFTIRGLSVFSLEQRELINERLQRFSQTEKLTSMGILAAGIAHEINNPLTNVSLNVEMLKKLAVNDERFVKKLNAIERNTIRASKIARELLDFSRGGETTFEPIDINQVIISTKNLLKNQELDAIIHLNLQKTSDIMGMSWKLEEVFINLLMNSIDACTAEDSIEVETFQKDSHVIVTITDTGYGIAKDEIFKVFDPFYTTKEIGKGTGLGLSICYNIIHSHDAEISIANNKERGTIVSMSFPVIEDSSD
jgi:signal transduction histidine kinase